MKTLDEVIKAMEYCQTPDQMGNCNVNCPYIHCCDPESVAIKTDALHYLKEYRETKKHLACLDDAEIRGDNTQVVNNPPLTWEELKSMEGKPVWVEYNLHISDRDARSRMWIIVQKIMPWRQDDELIYYSGFVFGKKEIGKTWLAYRKEIA